MVARNAIILLIILSQQDFEAAVDCVIHVWYSATLTRKHMDVLCGPLRTLVQDVCAKIANKAPDTVLGKTWHFESGSLRLVLSKKQWIQLLQRFEIPSGVTREQADKIRRTVTLAPERRDYRDRAMFTKPGHHRVAAIRFREDGILLPFGCSRDTFDIPNPTLFHSEEWPMKDSSDPLEGWSYDEVMKTGYGAANNDIYGKMHTLVTALLRGLCTRVKSQTIHFTLLNVDAKDLQTQVEDAKFARVEVRAAIC